MKGFTVQHLGGLAILFVVAVMMISIGGQILAQIQETQCDYTWVENYVNSPSVNPIDSSYTGCCVSINSTDSTLNCTSWATSDVSSNTTYKGLQGVTTFGNWLPLIALIVVASIVIGVIVAYLGRTGSA